MEHGSLFMYLRKIFLAMRSLFCFSALLMLPWLFPPVYCSLASRWYDFIIYDMYVYLIMFITMFDNRIRDCIRMFYFCSIIYLDNTYVDAGGSTYL
jgi:hypothetical protein